MITFEDEPSYQFLLNDIEELQKLKRNSYLDLDYLKNFKKYQVHLYYKDNLRTRITYWERKYPEIPKLIESDDLKIRIKFDKNNTLSKAIDEALQLPISTEILQHDKPPTPPGEIQVNKKVKIMGPFNLPTPDNQKTKGQLLSEVKNLRLALTMVSDDLQTRTEEKVRLEKVVSETQKKMQALVDQQKSFKNFFHQFINKLSPDSKSKYEDMFSNQAYKNGPRQEPEDLDIESPKSIPSSQLEVEVSQSYDHETEEEIITQMDKEFGGENDEVKEIAATKSSKSNKSSSFISDSDDKVPISPIQTVRLEEEKMEEKKPARIKSSSQKKSVKNAWDHLSSGILATMEIMKGSKKSFEELQQNIRTFSLPWQSVIRNNSAELKAFLQQ